MKTLFIEKKAMELRFIRAEDFATSIDGCLLQVSGKQRFYEAFRQKAPAFRCLLRHYARYAARVCQHQPAFR